MATDRPNLRNTAKLNAEETVDVRRVLRRNGEVTHELTSRSTAELMALMEGDGQMCSSLKIQPLEDYFKEIKVR